MLELIPFCTSGKRIAGYIALGVVTVLSIVGPPWCAWAQVSSTIFGIVTDPAGAAVPNVSVTVTNQQTGFSQTVKTDNSGQYLVTPVSVGRCTVTAEMRGFERNVTRDVEVRVNENVRVDIRLTLGAVTEEVEVVATGVGVETRSATLGKVIEEKRIVELPLNERNFLSLATLQPGVVPPIAIASNNTPEFSGGVRFTPQVNGLRLQSNNFLLDGADNNEPFLGTAMSTPSPDALEEFKILTNMYNAEFGGGGGSIVNIITKQGGNAFHGSIYEFFRNDKLDARNFFAEETEKLRRNQFGFGLGGPVIRDKTFFFGNYEGFRLREGTTRTAVVPSLAERAGNFSTFPNPIIDPTTGTPFAGNIIPAARLDPVAQALLSVIPEPNTGTNLHTSSPATEKDLNEFTIRVDHSLSPNNTLTARYHFNEGEIVRHFTATLFGIDIDVPNFPLADDFRLQNLVLADTHFFSPQLVNEFRFAFNRGRFDSAISLMPREPADFGFNLPSTKAIRNLPMVGVIGMSAFGTFNDSPSFRRENVFQVQDNVTLVAGNHNLKFGTNNLVTQMNIPSSDSIGEGAFLFVGLSGNPIADFMLGTPFLFFQGGGSTNRFYTMSSWQLFFQDEYRVAPTFTLNLGLRYELHLPGVDKRDRVVAFRPGRQSTVNPAAHPGLLFVGDEGITRSTIETDKNNFAPRLGFAWDILGTAKVSLRGGYGIFYDRIMGLIPFQFGLEPPFYPIPTIPFPFLTSFGDPFLGTSPFVGSADDVVAANIFPLFSFLQVLDEDMRTPYVQQWNLDLQWEAITDIVLEIGYVGTKSTKLPQPVDINTAAPTPPFAPFFFQISSYQTTARANYNALQLTANKRFSHGLAFLGSYTWSKSIDTWSVPVNFLNPTAEAVFPQDRTDLEAERGRSAFDARQRFVFNFNYELPIYRNRTDAVGTWLGGWQINGILTFQTGIPFTVLDGSDPNMDGQATDRPDIIGDPTAGTSTPDLFFNPAAFQRPAPGTNGNAGRNILSSPGINNVDFSIFKSFRIGERATVQFRTEFFSLFNHPNFDVPVNDINSPVAGRILQTRLPARQIQFGLKILF